LGYCPAPHGSVQAPPARVAPAVQSAEVNDVDGVGSTHWVAAGPQHCWHAGSHLEQTTAVVVTPETVAVVAAVYVPAAHADWHFPPSRIGFLVVGHTDL